MWEVSTLRVAAGVQVPIGAVTALLPPPQGLRQDIVKRQCLCGYVRERERGSASYSGGCALCLPVNTGDGFVVVTQSLRHWSALFKAQLCLYFLV